MSMRHTPPRQTNAKRKPVKKHTEKSVGTETASAPGFLNPLCKPPADQQAGMYYARAANSTGH